MVVLTLGTDLPFIKLCHRSKRFPYEIDMDHGSHSLECVSAFPPFWHSYAELSAAYWDVDRLINFIASVVM